MAVVLVVILGGAFLTAVTVAVVLAWRWRVSALRADLAERRLTKVERELYEAPFGHLIFDATGILISANLQAAFALPARMNDLAALTGAFDSEDGHRFEVNVAQLRASNTAFEATLWAAGGERCFMACGRDVEGRSTIWFAEVTDMAQARRGAAAETARLQCIYDALPLPLWWRDAELTIVGCNRTYADMVGQRPADVARQGTELLDRRLRDAGRDLAARARDEKTPARTRHHVVAHGERSLMELAEIPFAGDHLLGLGVDRTREEGLEGELARHTAAHGEVLESLSTAIAILSPELRLQFHNGAYAELWGLDSGFLDQQPHIADILEALRDRRALPEQSNFPQFKRDTVNKLRNLVEPAEELTHRPDGSTLKVTMVPHPFGGVMLTFEDVTDRLTLERNFNTLIEVQRASLENLHEGVAVYGSDGRLKLFNQTFRSLLGIPAETLREEPHVRDILDWARPLIAPGRTDWSGQREYMVSRVTEPEYRNGRMDLSNGTVLDWAQVPLPDGQTLFTYLDVTDSSRVERALRERAEALEAADQLKSEFIANISYELRTPLNAIAGFAEILENEFFGPINDRQREYARAIVESSQRLTTLINDILDLATIEAGYMELDYEDIRIADLLTNLRSIAQERARARGLTLSVDSADSVATFRGDLRRIKQALYNLLSNAFNFTPEGGRVTLRGDHDAVSVRLSVEDTGVGIPEEDRERVFEKFVRGQPRNPGAGLGLALVSKLVELHGGQVMLESPPNGGTRVTCILPLDPAQAHNTLPAAQARGAESAV